MFSDILTIIRKEWKEMLLRRGNYRGSLLNMAIILGMLGVFFPLQFGPDWLAPQSMVIIWCWVPVFLALSMVTDAFAGERERHTLETLLASRLSDRAILFGKIGAAIAYAWGISIAGMLVAAVTINIAYPIEGIRFYPLPFFAAVLAISLLVAGLFSSLGVLVSLRAETARQAYQRLGVVMILVFLLPSIGLQFVPQEFLTRLISGLPGVNIQVVLLVVIAVLLLANIGLIMAALARFQRARLILD